MTAEGTLAEIVANLSLERTIKRIKKGGSLVRLLDLFSGAGIGADGYGRAGFDVTCVDIDEQPENPHTFVRADALTLLEGDFPESFDVIHASPPCQAHTRAKHLRDAQGAQARYADFLTPTLTLLRKRWGHKTWIIENVPGAPGMEEAAVVCGSSFGLGVRRHRLFLSNRPLVSSVCDHRAQGRPWGVYHRPGDSIPRGGRTARDVEHGREVMGVTREVSWDRLKEGLPPAFTEFIGRQVV